MVSDQEKQLKFNSLVNPGYWGGGLVLLSFLVFLNVKMSIQAAAYLKYVLNELMCSEILFQFLLMFAFAGDSL